MNGVWVCVSICLSVCVSVSAAGNDSEPIPEEKEVLILNKSNFKQALKLHQQLLVHFYAPLSADSLGSILEFGQAAVDLKAALPVATVRLGRVDVTKETELAKELNVTGVPLLRLYLSGDTHNPVLCPALKSSASILTWLKRREGRSADIIADLSQSESFAAEHDFVVLGLFKDVEQGMVGVYYSVACDLADLPFGVTGNSDIFSKYDIISDSVLLLRKSKLEEKFDVTSETTQEDLIHFIRLNEMEPVTEYNGKTAPKILNSVQKNHAILFINKSDKHSRETQRAFESTAVQFKGQVLFVLIDTDEPRNGRILEYFRVRGEESPLVRIVNLTDNVQYQLPSDELNTHTLTQFCQHYLQGKAKPKLQSEPMPADWDKQPVKELVGMNFERVVFNEDNNVFVLFYAPWSAESRALFPLWEELAEHYRNHANVVIARIDVTANDVNIRLLERYPSLKLFTAVYAERIISYSGERKLKALVEFVETEIKRAKKERAKEEKERKKYVEAQKAAAKEEL